MNGGDSRSGADEVFKKTPTLIAVEIFLRRILLKNRGLKEFTPPALSVMHSNNFEFQIDSDLANHK